jgi:uncharacterized protein YcbX
MVDLSRPFVAGIYLHPVKSCRRVEVDHARVSEYGLLGDREWQVQGPAGQLMTQRKFPAMARVQPQPIPGGLRLMCDGMPDLDVPRPGAVDTEGNTMTGRVRVADAGDEAAAWLTRVLSIACRLASIGAGYERRPLIGDVDPFAQQVTFVDAAPIHLVSAASYRFLLDDAGEPFPIERFRPNLVVDGCQAWEEDTWRSLSIGAAELRVVLPWPRCAVPQVDQDTGERRREPAVVLKRHRWCTDASSLPAAVQPVIAGNALFGVAASISPPGATITRGGPVDVHATGVPLIDPPTRPAS